MSFAIKLLTGTVISAGAIAGWSYVQNLKKAGAELEVVPKASIYQLSWEGLTIRLDVLLKNPTKGSFSIRAPFIKLLYKDTTIGSSPVINKDIKIPPYGEVVIDKIMVEIPMTGVFSVVFSLIKSLYGKETLKLTVVTVTSINLGWIVLPYENKTDVILKN